MEPTAGPLEHDVSDGRFQLLGSGRLRQLDHVTRRPIRGRATQLSRARPDGAAARRRQRGVAVQHADLVVGHAQLAGDERSERGLVGLPVW